MINYYVIFEHNEAWWTRFFRPGYRHVSVVVKLKEGVFIHVNPYKRSLDYTVLTLEDVNKLFDYEYCSDIVVCTLEHKLDTYSINYKPSVFSCVELVKRTIGIKKWWVFTPYQLYKYITKEIR